MGSVAELELESVRRGRAKPMSGVMKRMGMIFRAKANKALDRAEDPR
ncbi:MAG: PspA/IM30 family protein, partial [Streptomyces sp.]|nr:PspA/IM30 family protein [Streptomyces sp.]